MHRFNVATDLKSSLKSATLGSGLRRDWHGLIASESQLMPSIMRWQRTLRAAKLVPNMWAFEQTELWFEIRKETDATDQRRFRAWWDLIFDVQRHPDDKESVLYAVLAVGNEQARRSYGKCADLPPARFKLEPEHAMAIVETVKRLFSDLLPREAAAGVLNASALLRPKYDRRPKN